uniref:Uncharacterized protein n=1 Tax=Equus asinus TaxID=9793 RepID=A0A9L0JTQ8_EQUAS
MLPIGTSTPKKRSLVPNLMEKGLMVLRSVASRDYQAPEWKLRQKQRSLSKSAQAISSYYRKMVWVASAEDTSFVSGMEELRKAFLMRPGCPQFSTRATSMSHFGSATTVALPEELCVSPRTWRKSDDLFDSQQGSDVKADGHLLPFSKSACEFNYLRKKSVKKQSHPTKRIPWYISVIHEKVRPGAEPWARILALLPQLCILLERRPHPPRGLLFWSPLRAGPQMWPTLASRSSPLASVNQTFDKSSVLCPSSSQRVALKAGTDLANLYAAQHTLS